MLANGDILVVATFVALLPIVNPFSTVPVFIALTQQFTTEQRRKTARMATIYMAIILLVAFVGGAIILNFFGISHNALRIAGGLIIASMGFSMLNTESATKKLSSESEDEARQSEEIAFTPLALPLMSGPGAIAVTISMATEAENFREHIAIAVGIIVVAIVSWMVLRASEKVQSLIGVTGGTVITRLMGFILVCIGVQFVMTGIYEAITNPQVLESISSIIRNLP